MCPRVDDLIVTLGVGDESHVVVLGDLADFLVTFLDERLLRLRDDDIVEVERQTCLVGHAVTEVLDTVEELASLGETNVLDDVGDDVAQALLRDDLVDIAYLVGDDAIDDDTTHRGLDRMADFLAIDDVVDNHLHLGVQVALALVVGDDGLLGTIERQALALGTRADLRDIIESEHHVL